MGQNVHFQELKGILARPSLSSLLRRSFFEKVKKMVYQIRFEELQECRRHCVTGLLGKRGILDISNWQLELSDKASPIFKNHILNGKGPASFGIEVYKFIQGRLDAVAEAEDIYKYIEVKEADLKRHLDVKKNQDLFTRKELYSEIILTDCWTMIKSADKIIQDLNDASKLDELKYKLEFAIDSAVVELENMSARLGDHMSLIIKAKSAQSLPVKVKKQIHGMCLLFTKIFRSQLLLVNQLNCERIELGKIFQMIADNIQFTLMYAIHTLPNKNVFAEYHKGQIENGMRVFQLYFNLLHDMDEYDPENLRFSEDTQLIMHYIPEVKGKDVDMVIQMLGDIVDNPRFTAGVAEKFFDLLMLDIDIWLSRRIKIEKDILPAVAVKKWILESRLQLDLEDMLGRLEEWSLSLQNYIQSESDRYLPDSMVSLLLEIHFVVSLLLDKREKFFSILNNPQFVVYQRKLKEPRVIRLEMYSAVFSNHKSETMKQIHKSMVDLHKQINQVVVSINEAQKSEEINRFEKMIKSCLQELGFKGMLIEAFLNPRLKTELLKQPKIKNQSWTRNKILKLIALSEKLSKVMREY